MNSQRSEYGQFETASPITADKYIDKKDYISAFWKSIFEKAESLKASDIHVKTSDSSILIDFRVSGELRRVLSKQCDNIQKLSFTNRLKQISSCDLSVQDETQSRSFFLKSTNCNYRLELCPSVFAEYFVLRVIRLADIPNLQKTGLNSSTIAHFKEALSQKQGLILMTGPTGSGKSTTLQSGLMFIDRSSKNVIAIEDPIERTLPSVTHIQISPKVTWKKAIRSAVRLDPDVILIGEIRDQESASLAIEAAQTGHLVISTLHTNDVAGTIDRLCDPKSGFGIDRRLVADNLLLVAAQRLPQLICPDCKIPNSNSNFFTRGLGCKTCQPDDTGTPGVIGRKAALEYSFRPNPNSIYEFDKKHFNETQLEQSLLNEHISLALRGEIDGTEVEKFSNSSINQFSKVKQDESQGPIGATPAVKASRIRTHFDSNLDSIRH